LHHVLFDRSLIERSLIEPDFFRKTAIQHRRPTAPAFLQMTALGSLAR
jgi:hypothetical protein